MPMNLTQADLWPHIASKAGTVVYLVPFAYNIYDYLFFILLYDQESKAVEICTMEPYSTARSYHTWIFEKFELLSKPQSQC